jgi:hypothetical protein
MRKTINNSANYFALLFLVVFIALLVAGCAAPKPTPDPLAGWQKAYKEEPSQAIVKDYQDYIHTLSPEEQKYVGSIFFYEDAMGQHAIRIEIGLNGIWWEHVLIYDKADRRIRTIKYANGGYRS